MTEASVDSNTSQVTTPGHRRRSRLPLRLGAAVGAGALLAAGLVGAASAVGSDESPAPAAVPAHTLTGYWHNFDNGSTLLKLGEVSPEYDIIAVSFAASTATAGQLDFELDPVLGYGSEQEFKDDIAAKQAEGVAVVLSVGGAEDHVTVNDDASASAFSESALGLIEEYGFDGIDIDLEHGIDAQYMSQAMEAVHAGVGDDLVYTMAPQTLDMQSTDTEYFQLALNTKDFLTAVHTQFYNSGSMLGCDGQVYSAGTVDFLTALACVQLEGGLDASQVGLGVPATPDAAGSGYVEPGVVNDALDCLTQGTNCGSFTPEQTYPELRGAMTWSVNWDANAGNSWSDTVGPHVHALP
ncbi:chitinase [Streptomyces sedi]|uniref:chitinase n=1 Tax=Streptomyces sedi TaxID=555059 RepID=A0A5C4V9X3_9ACTN|nr:chitinase [Streptomyces sedi]